MKTVFELLNHDNTISVNRRLAHALGLSEAVIYAALLAKHAWYEQHGKLSDGWFYSTVDDMEESTSLTKCQQSRCVKRLVSAGLIRCAAKGLPARRFFTSWTTPAPGGNNRRLRAVPGRKRSGSAK